MQTKRLTPDQARLKIQSFCAYQERSHREVRDKLYGYGLYKDEVDQLTVELLDQNFLNEERFAQAYVSGKFRIKKWGGIGELSNEFLSNVMRMSQVMKQGKCGI